MDASKIEEEIDELSGVLSAHNNDDRSDSQEARLRELKSKKVVQSMARAKLTFFRAKSCRSARFLRRMYYVNIKASEYNSLRL